MKYENIQTIDFFVGDEEKIEQLLYRSSEPLVIRIRDFPLTFDLDFFINSHESDSSYYQFNEGKLVEFAHDKFTHIIKNIKDNQPIRIFGEYVANDLNNKVKQAIPLWQKIPFRPRYFEPVTGDVIYFFGGKDAHTGIHYDRELNSNLHICLHGKKRVLLFTDESTPYLYKTPFISNSLVDFSKPIAECEALYPKLEHAVCYDVILNPGDMLYMPKRCWHHMDYIEPNASATFAFYPKKIDQFLGMLSGLFYLGFSTQTLSLSTTKLFKTFSRYFAKSEGVLRVLLKSLEVVSYALLFPLCSSAFLYRYKVKGGRLY